MYVYIYIHIIYIYTFIFNVCIYIIHRLYTRLYTFSGCFWIIHLKFNPKHDLRPFSMVPLGLRIMHGERGWGRNKLIVQIITFRQLLQVSTTMVAPRVYCPFVSQGWQPIKIQPPSSALWLYGVDLELPLNPSIEFLLQNKPVLHKKFQSQNLLKKWKGKRHAQSF